MKVKCLCGCTHNFQAFKRYKTSWKGTTTHYQFFCQKLKKLIILTTTTFPAKITDAFCPSLKKFRKTVILQTSDECMASEVYMLGEAEKE